MLDFLLIPLNQVIIGLWALSAVLDYTEFCYFWQLKEYRLDRMRDFFSTKQGQQFFFRYSLLWRSILALVLLFWPINQSLMLRQIILAGFTIDVLRAVYRLYKHKMRLPKPTPKAALVILAAVILEGGLGLVKQDWGVVFLLLILRFPMFGGVVLVINKFTQLVKNWYIKTAAQKIAAQSQLLVIGITGSYGKSTVKEYVSHILGQKFRVVKTPRNINTDIGVAKFILGQNFTGVNVFVVEMGAYKIGEIAKICQMVKPKVGILTAIIEQHLSLFGSIVNIQQTKYELLRAIPPDGLVITNADNQYCTELLGELSCQTIRTFGNEPERTPTILIEDVTAHGRQIVGNVRYNGHIWSITAPVIGAHQILNIAPAILVADYLGLSQSEIVSACTTLPTAENSLKMYPFGQATIIDDSYNSNPNGFRAALEILGSFPSAQKRIVITRGMLELGERTQEIHETIAEEIAFYADTLVITTPDAADALERGAARLKDKYHLDIERHFEPVELVAYMANLKNTNSVILIENRLPGQVYQMIKPTNTCV